MSRTTAHTVKHASIYEGNPEQNKSSWQKARPFNNPNRHPVKNALEAEAAKVKRTTDRKVARTLVPTKEVKSAKRQKDTEEETCECLLCDEQFGNSRPGEKWVSCTDWQVGPRGLHKQGSMLCLPQL